MREAVAVVPMVLMVPQRAGPAVAARALTEVLPLSVAVEKRQLWRELAGRKGMCQLRNHRAHLGGGPAPWVWSRLGSDVRHRCVIRDVWHLVVRYLDILRVSAGIAVQKMTTKLGTEAGRHFGTRIHLRHRSSSDWRRCCCRTGSPDPRPPSTAEAPDRPRRA
jgi:hypothetical protein